MDLSDDAVGFDLSGAEAFFGDDGHFGVEGFGVGVGHFDAADVRGDDDEVFKISTLDVVEDDRGCVEVVDGDVEEALDLAGVEVHGEDAVDACGSDEVGDEFGTDGNPAFIFAVLASIAEEGDDGGDAVGGGTTGRVDHDEEFHQVMIGRRGGGLDEEEVVAADVFLNFDEGFAVWEGGDLSFGEVRFELAGDLLGKVRVGGA